MRTEFRPDNATQPLDRLRALRALLDGVWRSLDIVSIDRVSTSHESGWKVTYVPRARVVTDDDQEEVPDTADSGEDASILDVDAESFEREQREEAGAEPPEDDEDDDRLGPPRRR